MLLVDANMNLIEVFILAVVQGVTEWLPISSSGHLVLMQTIFRQYSSEWQVVPVFFDVILHIGTLLVVLAIFWRDIAKILEAVVRLNFKTEEGKLALYIILGSIPTAIIGFLFEETFTSFFSNLLAVGFAFLFTGSLLYATRFRKNLNKPLNYLDAFLVGTAQGVALIPGVSRSGATIATGLLRRVKRDKAFQYSFLLYIPAVVGATLRAGLSEWQTLTAVGIDLFSVALGLTVTFVVGYIFLRLLFKLLVKEKFYVFAYYCWTLGLLIISTQILTAA